MPTLLIITCLIGLTVTLIILRLQSACPTPAAGILKCHVRFMNRSEKEISVVLESGDQINGCRHERCSSGIEIKSKSDAMVVTTVQYSSGAISRFNFSVTDVTHQDKRITLKHDDLVRAELKFTFSAT